MEKLHFSVIINAPKQKVWETMLNDATYRQWTDIFNPSSGSYYEGEWKTGSDMNFYGPNEDGTVSGMYAKIKEARPYDFVSIQHLGEVINGVRKPWPDSGTEAFENYTLNETDGGTELLIDLDTNEEFKSMFEDLWPKALQKLKELAERN
jgi:uncharacterized protein YndB with AHSA1/START domain